MNIYEPADADGTAPLMPMVRSYNAELTHRDESYLGFGDDTAEPKKGGRNGRP